MNAVAHRDYTDNSSVQVMLFADRLEVMNSGRLPPPLTVDKLRQPHQSLPGNPLLAESMYLLQYIERMGTGTVDMIRRCAEAGLPEPEFEVGAGFLIRIWRSGDRETRQATGTARKQPENSQKTTGSQGQQPENDQKTARKPTEARANRQKRHPSPTASSPFSARTPPRAAAKSPTHWAPRNPSSGTGWTSCARPGRSSASVPTRGVTGRSWANPTPSPT